MLGQPLLSFHFLFAQQRGTFGFGLFFLAGQGGGFGIQVAGDPVKFLFDNRILGQAAGAILPVLAGAVGSVARAFFRFALLPGTVFIRKEQAAFEPGRVRDKTLAPFNHCGSFGVHPLRGGLPFAF